MSEAIKGYAEDAIRLIPKFEGLSSEDLYAPLVHLLPPPGARVLDLGAGSGRDAAWLAARGCTVLAVEPVPEFVAAGRRLHPELRWLEDALPGLERVRALEETFDFVLLSGVWHHLDPDQRRISLPRIAALLDLGGRLLLTLRHGPCPAGRPGFPESLPGLIELAAASGLRLVSQDSHASVQAWNRERGVRWDDLVFERD